MLYFLCIDISLIKTPWPLSFCYFWQAMEFQLVSDFKPTGDQPEAIRQLAQGLASQDKFQTLLGVTGSGKTFTVANVIAETRRPTLVLAHNKTLAAQLYSEFKQFFPNNAVEYFVSYYDYYQPEAYIPTTGTYIRHRKSRGIQKKCYSHWSGPSHSQNKIFTSVGAKPLCTYHCRLPTRQLSC